MSVYLRRYVLRVAPMRSIPVPPVGDVHGGVSSYVWLGIRQDIVG